MLDLYKVYRGYKQRLARAKSEEEILLATGIVEIMKELLDAPTLKNCNQLGKAEDQYLQYKKRGENYSDAVAVAIRSKKYEINRPYINQINVNNYNPDYGYIYVAVSEDKPGEVKLGFTTDKINKRLSSMKAKYQYKSLTLYFSQWISKPAEVEKLVSDQLNSVRSSAMRRHDSIEWYRASPDAVAELIRTALLKQPAVDAITLSKSSVTQQDESCGREERSGINADTLLLTPSPALAAIVGADPLPRTEVVTRVWKHITLLKLQDAMNHRMLNADTKLLAVFGKPRIDMFDMAGFLTQHLK